MLVCHGQGDLDHDGCCYVEGQVCPLRWKLVKGRILAGPNLVDIGSPPEAVASVMPDATPSERFAVVRSGIGGRTFICSAALRHGGDWSAVHTDPEYVENVRPAWERIEERMGLEPGAYQCGTWSETFGRGQCCFGEPPETNARKGAWISEVTVEIGRKP